MEDDHPDRTLRRAATDGQLHEAGYRCRTLRYWKTLGPEIKMLAEGEIVPRLVETYDDVEVLFSTDGVVSRSPAWFWRTFRKGNERAQTKIMPFATQDIRTIEPAPCKALRGGGHAMIRHKGQDIPLWLVTANLHSGRTITLVEHFLGQEAASYASTQLAFAWTEIRMAMQANSAG